MFCKAIYTMRRPLFSFKYVLQGNLYNMATLFSFKYVLQGNLYNAATSGYFQVCFARQYIHCCDLCAVSSMFCKAINTMCRPLFSFKYVLQSNLYNAANSGNFQVCFARQYIHCGDLCAVSSMFCKAINTMCRPLFSFKYVLQGNLYNASNSVHFQVCFARQSIQCGDLC